jgi:dihydropteroate synthase
MNASSPQSAVGAFLDPARATAWKIRGRQIELPRRPLIMGIVNVTPDSFSDGGQFFDPSRAVEHGLRLAAEGADLLDIGGESTRPESEPIAVGEEIRRTAEVVRALAEVLSIPISIDTSKSAVAREAVAAGAHIVNDVTALTGDPAMLDVVRDSQVGVVAMHMQETPLTMQLNPVYGDVVAEVRQYLRMRRDALRAAGIDRASICLDPGIGFGKTHQHNLTLLSQCWRFHELGCPILVGHSRKGFIAKVIGDNEADRTPGTIGAALALAGQGVQIIRVHDAAPLRQALLLFEACGGIDGQAIELPVN